MALRLVEMSILWLAALFLVQFVQPGSAMFWPKVQYGSNEDGVIITLPRVWKPIDLKEVLEEKKDKFEDKIAQFFEDDEKKLKLFGKLLKFDEKKEEKIESKADDGKLCKNNNNYKNDDVVPCAYEQQQQKYYQPAQVYSVQPPAQVYYEPAQENLPCCEDVFYS